MNHLCCGVAIQGDLADRFAPSRAEPLADVQVQLVHSLVRRPRARTLWAAEAHDEASGVRQHQELLADGARRLLEIDGQPTLEIDPASPSGPARVRAVAGNADVVVQLLAAVALPVVAVAAGAQVLHGSAVAVDGLATAVVGPSGAGKSTLLRAAVDGGWEALTEDVCVVDAPDRSVAGAGPPAGPRLWPGPPWLRLDRSVRLPIPWVVAFAASDKTAWDLAAHLAPVPRPLGRIVLLEPAGGRAPELERLDRVAAIARLVPHVTFLGSPERRRADAFAAAVRLASRVEVHRLRLPRDPDWATTALALLGGP